MIASIPHLVPGIPANTMPAGYPTTMAELQAQMANGMLPGLMPPAPLTPPVSFVTADQVRAIVAEEMKRMHPAASAVATGVMQQIGVVLEKALTPEDLAEFQQYMTNGAPGFTDLMQSDKLHPIAQLFWETVKENMK